MMISFRGKYRGIRPMYKNGCLTDDFSNYDSGWGSTSPPCLHKQNLGKAVCEWKKL